MKTKPKQVVRKCAECGTEFNAASDYLGRPGAPTRRYCAIWCRDTAAYTRRKRMREHLYRNRNLIELHRQEAAGQLSIVSEPLPPVPTEVAQ